MDVTFPRVATHPQLKRLFQGHSNDSQMRQRQLVLDAFCHALGGPCLYFGRPMKPLHAGLGITTEDWATFMAIVSGVLGELRLPAPEQREFLALLEERFRDDVVDRPQVGH